MTQNVISIFGFLISYGLNIEELTGSSSIIENSIDIFSGIASYGVRFYSLNGSLIATKNEINLDSTLPSSLSTGFFFYNYNGPVLLTENLIISSFDTFSYGIRIRLFSGLMEVKNVTSFSQISIAWGIYDQIFSNVTYLQTSYKFSLTLKNEKMIANDEPQLEARIKKSGNSTIIKWHLNQNTNGKYNITNEKNNEQDAGNLSEFLEYTSSPAFGSNVYTLQFLDNNGLLFFSHNLNFTLIYPFLTSFAILNYELGSSAEVSWHINIPNHSGFLSIFQNDTEILRKNWQNENPIIFPINFINSTGTFNLSIFILQNSQFRLSDTILVTIHDKIFPSLLSSLNFRYSYNLTNFPLNWTAFDLSGGGNYNVSFNETIIASGSWVSDTNISIPITNLNFGENELKLIIFDKSSNKVEHLITIELYDNILPILSENSTVFHYEKGSTSNSIILNVTGRHLEIITAQLRDQTETLIENSKIITSASAILILKFFLPEGLVQNMNYTIYISDDSNEDFVIHEVQVIVHECLSLKVRKSPNDALKPIKLTNNSFLSWEVCGIKLKSFTIFINGASDKVSKIDGEVYTINYTLGHLNLGNYNVTLVVFDSTMNNIVDQVLIEIVNANTNRIQPTGTSISSESLNPNQITTRTLFDNPVFITLIIIFLAIVIAYFVVKKEPNNRPPFY